MLGAAVWLMLSSILYSLRLSNGSGSFPKPLTAKEEQHYLELAAQGDLEARNILIERNLRLVAHIMKKYYTQTSDQEDLISIGTIGLIKGISTFDASKGARLATYAARCVENEILMHFRSAKKLSAEVHFDEPVDTDKNGNCLTLMDIIADDEMPVEDKCGLRSDLARLENCLRTELEQREREILVMRYGLGKSPPLTQRETAKLLGISRSYVSRIEKKALQQLRAAMETPC